MLSQNRSVQSVPYSKGIDSVTISIQSSVIHTVASVILGAVILYAVGFLPTDAVHNAAHDTRHSLAFPCH